MMNETGETGGRGWLLYGEGQADNGEAMLGRLVSVALLLPNQPPQNLKNTQLTATDCNLSGCVQRIPNCGVGLWMGFWSGC